MDNHELLISAIVQILGSEKDTYVFEQPCHAPNPAIDLRPVARRFFALNEKLGGVLPYEPGYVYAISAVGTNYIKFGKTKNPSRRILEISPKMPFETAFLKVWATNFMSHAERWLHERFADKRTNGEWFSLSWYETLCLFDTEAELYTNQLRYSYASEISEFVTSSSEEEDSLSYYLLRKKGIDCPFAQPFKDGHLLLHLTEQIFEEINRTENPDLIRLIDQAREKKANGTATNSLFRTGTK